MWKAPIDLTDELLEAAIARYVESASQAGQLISPKSVKFQTLFRAAVDAELENVWSLLFQAGLGRTHRPAGENAKRSQRMIDRDTYERVREAYGETHVTEMKAELNRAENEIASVDSLLGGLEADSREARRASDRESTDDTLKEQLESLKERVSAARSHLRKAERKANRLQEALSKALDSFNEPVDISFNRIARCCLVRYAYPDKAAGSNSR